MNISSLLSEKVKACLSELYQFEAPESALQLQKTKKEFEGDFTLVVFPFVKAARKKPAEVAQEMGEWLQSHTTEISGFNVIQGFLNLSIAAEYWMNCLNNIASTDNFGFKKPDENARLVMIEYSSPNTNKPLHLGHLRNILLGWSLSQIMEACGNKVVKTNIVNDRGIHICKSMLAWQKWFDGATPESTGKKGDHLIGDCYVAFDKHFKAEVKDILEHDPEIAQITDPDPDKQAEARKAAAEAKSPLMLEAREMLRKWEAADPEVRSLWAKMNEWVYAGFDETYRMMGVGFDKIYYESQTYLEGKGLVMEGLKEGKFYRRDDGSVWADLTGEGLDHKLLLRKDGTSVYMTQDIGTAKLRYQDFPIDKMIYVVGNEQNYHFQVLSILLDRLGFKWGKDLVHFSYGMVELPNGRMKSREGTVVDADDLMASMIGNAKEVSSERLDGMTEAEKDDIYRIIGLGALKYFLLKVNPVNNMVFNPAESIDFNGNTGPFIQYTHARIKSVLRKAGAECGMKADAEALQGVEISEKEQTLIQKLVDFESTVLRAGAEYSPSLIANYTYDLAKEYNQFYHDTPILKEEDEQKRTLRLVLSDSVAKVIKTAMTLLGIEVPERM